jgi:hypothetical protein
MKAYILFCLVWLALSCALAQANAVQHKWSATLKVVDENANPVAGANASIGYFTNSQPASFEGLTDFEGLFSATHSAQSDLNVLGFEAKKAGFYTTRIGCDLFPPYEPAKWNLTQKLVLKKVEKPIGMYAKQINSLKFPEYNKVIGYDLMIGDWVAPYGKGANSDIRFIEHHADAKSGYTFTISFPNLGDGIQEFTVPDAEKGSELRSAHEAPVDGYQPVHEQTQMADPHRGYFLRVRTTLDHNGNIVSALYGKIYGDFMQFNYYLNPTPNDRNIEFDPKHNLLRGLKSYEQVTAP